MKKIISCFLFLVLPSGCVLYSQEEIQAMLMREPLEQIDYGDYQPVEIPYSQRNIHGSYVPPTRYIDNSSEHSSREALQIRGRKAIEEYFKQHDRSTEYIRNHVKTLEDLEKPKIKELQEFVLLGKEYMDGLPARMERDNYELKYGGNASAALRKSREFILDMIGTFETLTEKQQKLIREHQVLLKEETVSELVSLEEQASRMIEDYASTQEIINECLALSSSNARPEEVIACNQRGVDSLQKSLEY